MGSPPSPRLARGSRHESAAGSLRDVAAGLTLVLYPPIAIAIPPIPHETAAGSLRDAMAGLTLVLYPPQSVCDPPP